MLPTNPPQLRFVQAARRARLRRLVAAGALVVLPVACGDDDAAVFQTSDDAVDAAETTTAETTADTTAETTADTTAETTAETTTAETTAETTATADDSTVPATTEMVVDFTYTASSSGGRVHNPYIAVWVEDTDGNLVQTISLWYLQSEKGLRWLPDLSSWYSTSGGDALTSGATRSAGSYSVVWDGTDLDGDLVATGEYVLYVESAREDGPHSVTAATITLGNEGFSVSLPDDGELSALTASLTA